MDRLIAIEFEVTVLNPDKDETLNILNEHDITIVSTIESDAEFTKFECRTNTRESYYAVMDALEEHGIANIIHE